LTEALAETVFIGVTLRLSLQLRRAEAIEEEKSGMRKAVKKDASRIDELDHQTFAKSKLTRKSTRIRKLFSRTNRHSERR
jgi:putative heme iron utilization protein